MARTLLTLGSMRMMDDNSAALDGPHKLLIGYDGSKSSDAAIDDLAMAGLPASGEALVVSVAEVWLPPDDAIEISKDEGWEMPHGVEEAIRRSWRHGKALVDEADALAKHALKRVRQLLPGWAVRAVATYGSPAWEVLAKAENLGAELIVVGSQGRSAFGRFVLGSISQQVLIEAGCSVRVGRGRIEIDGAPARILLAFDGSKGSIAAARTVAGRKWPAGTEVRIVSAVEQLSPSAIGRFISPVTTAVAEVNTAEHVWLTESVVEIKSKIEAAGLGASVGIIGGNPKHVLVEEAERWNADCIFLGANRFASRAESFLLGSTSAAVAARAHCSVEAVRVRATMEIDT